MPHASNLGVRIHYQVTGATGEASAPPLVIQHGFSSSGEALRKLGYVEALGACRQLILIDARGHGASDKPHDPGAYVLARRVGDITAVLDEIGVQQADFLGYSMGGWIGFGMLAFAGGRIGRAIIGGAHPFADDAWAGFARIDPGDDDAFILAMEAAIGERFGDEVKPMILDNDRIALAASARLRDSLLPALTGSTAPVLLYAGSGDARRPEIERAAETLPSAALRILPGLSHAEVYMRPDLVAPVVEVFLGHRSAAD